MLKWSVRPRVRAFLVEQLNRWIQQEGGLAVWSVRTSEDEVCAGERESKTKLVEWSLVMAYVNQSVTPRRCVNTTSTDE